MKRTDDPALYRAAERLLESIVEAADGSPYAAYRRRALRLIREAMAESFQAGVRVGEEYERGGAKEVEYAYERLRDGRIADTTEGGFGAWTQELATIAAQRRERDDIALAKHRKRRNPYTYRVVKRTIGPWVPA